MDSNSHASGGHRPPSLPATRQRRNWLAIGFVLLLLSPFVAGLVWYIVVRASNSSAITRLENEARRRGEPLTPAELFSIYAPIPEEQNAAILLLELWAKEDPGFWKAFVAGTRPLPERASRKFDPAIPIVGSSASRWVRGTAVDPQALALAQEYLSNEAAHMVQVRAALRRPQARFPLAFGETFNMLLPHLAILKHEAQNFRLAALVAADQGDVDASIAALRDTARAGQVLADSPILIDQLVRVACLAIALNGVEDLMSRHKLTLPQLAEAKNLLGDLKTAGGFKQAMLGERAMSTSVFSTDSKTVANFASNPEGSTDEERTESGFQAGIAGMKIIGLAAADKRLMLETFQQVIALADEETSAALAKIERAFQECNVEARKFPPKIFTAMLLPALERAATKFAALEARRRAALTAVAIEEFRLQHTGKPPGKLDELITQFLPAVPTDPFDGQPLRYKILEKGYVVYSIGADRSDDGGGERKPKSLNQRIDETSLNQRIDETFTVERQP